MRSSLPAVAALALLLVASCGNGVDDLSVTAPPLVTLKGSVEPALVASAGAPVRAALVWANVPNYVTACVVYPGNDLLQAACPDPFLFVAGPNGADVEVAADGTFELPIMHLPPASVSVGSPDQSIAWGSVIVAADSDGNGAFDLLQSETTGSGRGAATNIKIADTVLAASFFSLHELQQRVGFREGTFDSESTFYPLANCDAPPSGFSVLSTPGFQPPALVPAEGDCTSAPLASTSVTPVALTADQASALACRELNFATVDSPPADQPGTSTSPYVPATEGTLVCLDAKTAAFITTGDCPTITTYSLAACSDDLLCLKPDWDMTASPPSWWTCAQ